jgi:hypothetical protein
MIPIPAGWRASRVQRSLLLQAPEGAIRYVERSRPLGHVVDLVREHRAPEGFAETRMTRSERFVTSESEYGALVVEGRIGERPVDHVFAYVFGDEFARRAHRDHRQSAARPCRDRRGTRSRNCRRDQQPVLTSVMGSS